MADTLIPGNVFSLTATPATIYTCPASTIAVTTFMRVANTTSGAVTLRLYVVPAAGSAAAANAIAFDFPIPAFDFLDMAKGLQLAAGSFVQASASSAGALTIKLDVIQTSV